MKSECRFLNTEVDGSNPGISMLCPLYIHTHVYIYIKQRNAS